TCTATGPNVCGGTGLFRQGGGQERGGIADARYDWQLLRRIRPEGCCCQDAAKTGVGSGSRSRDDPARASPDPCRPFRDTGSAGVPGELCATAFVPPVSLALRLAFCPAG